MNTNPVFAFNSNIILIVCMILTLATILCSWRKVLYYKNKEKLYTEDVKNNKEILIALALYLKIFNSNIISHKNSINKQVDEIYETFIHELKYQFPELTNLEEGLCAMLYINMCSKEIADITKTSVRSVETSRYRLRKKLNLPHDEDITCYLQTKLSTLVSCQQSG